MSTCPDCRGSGSLTALVDGTRYRNSSGVCAIIPRYREPETVYSGAATFRCWTISRQDDNTTARN